MKLKCLRLCLFALFVFQASAIIGQARKVNGRVLSDDSGPLEMYCCIPFPDLNQGNTK